MTTAFIFPGQGSQSVGMLSDLVAEYAVVKNTFAEASDALGYNLEALVLNGPEADLNQTDRTQPALLTASTAIYRLLQEQGAEKPTFLAGHSLGEYSALVAAEVIAFADAVKLVEQRGQFMQQAVPAGVGAMSAIIGLDDAAIVKACEEAQQEQVVSAVNYNSPGQVVIAGNKEAVERANELCKAAGAKRALPLPVSVPSHCALMNPAAEKLAETLSSLQFNSAVIPVVNNVDVKVATDSDAIKDALVRQLFSPVRWTETIQYLASQQVTSLFEIGPGKVLTGLTKRIDKSVSCQAINTIDSINLLLEN